MLLLPNWLYIVVRVALLFIPIIGMGVLGVIAWRNDFPRWSFPLIGAIIYGILFAAGNLIISGITFTGAGIAAVAAAAIMLVGILSKFSLKPLSSIASRIKEDPWLILFAFYFFIAMVFATLPSREVDSWSAVIAAVAITGVFSWGWCYFLTNPDKSRRGVILLLSLSAVLIISMFF